MHLPGCRARRPYPPAYGVIVRTVLFLSIVILAGTSGELLMAHVMKQAGRARTIKASGVIGLFARAFRPSAMWISIALQAAAFFSLLALLSWDDLSFVVPITALNYVVSAAGSALFLRERVDRTRWAGVLLVCIGVAVMCASEW
jgi:drug/metabolite transporter (DMT)-like permease